jgi:hypothetical protein
MPEKSHNDGAGTEIISGILRRRRFTHPFFSWQFLKNGMGEYSAIVRAPVDRFRFQRNRILVRNFRLFTEKFPGKKWTV